MKIKRRKQEIHTGLAVKGGGLDRKVPSTGAGITIALAHAHSLPVGEYVAVLEYGDEIGRAVRTEEGAIWRGAPMKKKALKVGLLLLALDLLVVLALTITAVSKAAPPEKVTICHVAGRADDPANLITLTLPWVAVYGQAGHFNENGTPQAGHEEDYLGPCVTTPPDPEDPPTDPDPPTGDRCPEGMTPTAGKDGEPGNDECEYPPTPPTDPPPSTPEQPQHPVPHPWPPELTPGAPVTKPTAPAKPPVTKPSTPAHPQPSATKAGNVTSPTPSTAETLPYTGLQLWVWALIGAALSVAGLILRRS